MRHTYNVSVLYSLPSVGSQVGWPAGGVAGALLGGWDVGAIVKGRSGVPLDVRVTRPDVVYRDNATGAILGARARLLGAGQHPRGRRVARRAAPRSRPRSRSCSEGRPAVAEPGGVRHTGAGHVRKPRGRRTARSKVLPGGPRGVEALPGWRATSNVEIRGEVFNLFNRNNYDVPPATLNNALGTGTNQVQPGQPFTQAAAGSAFGRLRSTVGTTVGMGTQPTVAVRGESEFLRPPASERRVRPVHSAASGFLAGPELGGPPSSEPRRRDRKRAGRDLTPRNDGVTCR